MRRRCSLPHHHRWRLLCLGALLTFIISCTGEVQLTVPGCDDCPDRCLHLDGGKTGKCVPCLNDKHCQSDSSPTKKCTDANKCICGSDQDCPDGQHCAGAKGCVECLEDQHCTTPGRGVCDLSYNCVSCKPGDSIACTPKGLDVCTPGVQTCKAGGIWGECENWLQCKGGEQCKEDKCVPACNHKCEEKETQCTTAKGELPGAFKSCQADTNGCRDWSGSPQSCNDKEVCDKGQCVPYQCPTAPCKEGETRCTSVTTFQTCQLNKLGCPEWSTDQNCPQSEQCSSQLNKCSVCEPGSTKSCFPGNQGTPGVGICKAGTQTCKTDGSGYEACQGAVAPGTEICNGQDDNCDGNIDEKITRSCYSGDAKTKGVGTCKAGTQACVNGQYASCVGEILPAQEKCANKLDDDCDGVVDETSGRALQFSGGSDRIEVPHHTGFNLSGSFTMELWYYLDGLGTRQIALLVNKHKANENDRGYHLKIQDPNSQCGFSWWNKTQGNQLLFGTCPQRVWTHIALVYDSTTTTYRFYLNGKKIKDGKQQMTIDTNTHPLVFATETATFGDPNFRGQFGAIRISKVVRYTADFTPPCTFKADANDVAVWNLEDGAGNVVKDASANKIDGTVYTAKWTKGRTCNAATNGGCTP